MHALFLRPFWPSFRETFRVRKISIDYGRGERTREEAFRLYIIKQFNPDLLLLFLSTFACRPSFASLRFPAFALRLRAGEGGNYRLIAEEGGGGRQGRKEEIAQY